MRYAFINEHRKHWPIKVMCLVMRVAPSGFHAWRARPLSTRAERRQKLIKRIREAFKVGRSNYGSPRIYHELLANGVVVSLNTVARAMTENGIKVKRKPPFVPQTTDSSHNLPTAPNLLNRDFHASAPNQKWVADITYIRTKEHWLYLAVVLDLYSRKVVGWAMADHMRAELNNDALKMALSNRRPDLAQHPLLTHSDRGSQYASDDHQHLIAQHGLTCSMSRRGNCYDNAVMESFFSSLKKELVNGANFETHSQARAVIFEYIEVFYNRVRRHSTLNYMSPEEFEARNI